MNDRPISNKNSEFVNKKLELLKLLADETRLEILNLLLKEDSYVEKIACELSLTPATICYHLKKMESAGIVNCSRSQFYIIYSLNRDVFDKPLFELIKLEKNEADTEEKYQREVISNFFKFGKLIQLPKQRKKREIVLLEIAKEFAGLEKRAEMKQKNERRKQSIEVLKEEMKEEITDLKKH